MSFSEIPECEVEALARCLLPAMQAYFDSSEGQAAFQQWKDAQTQKTT